MASPQVEDGHLKIADGIQDALLIADISRNEDVVMGTIMMLTWRIGKTKARISAEDIHAYLGNTKRLWPGRINELLARLEKRQMIFRQAAGKGEIIGIQKDFERWNGVEDKHKRKEGGSRPSQQGSRPQSVALLLLDINTSNTASVHSLWTWLLNYSLKVGNRKLSPKAYQVEGGRVRSIYSDLIREVRDPEVAFHAIRDYIDYEHGDEFVQGVNFFWGYAITRFNQWHKSLPKKDHNELVYEKHKNVRSRYNKRLKRWEDAPQ